MTEALTLGKTSLQLPLSRLCSEDQVKSEIQFGVDSHVQKSVSNGTLAGLAESLTTTTTSSKSSIKPWQLVFLSLSTELYTILIIFLSSLLTHSIIHS